MASVSSADAHSEGKEGEHKDGDDADVRSLGTTGSFERSAVDITGSLRASTPQRHKMINEGGKGGGWAHNSEMLAAKDERKRAEYDVQLLANRLAFLRAEEAAAKKKIRETKMRTKQVVKAKVAAKRQDDVSKHE